MPGMDPNEADQRLRAAVRSPELASMIAGQHEDPSPRYRRIAVFAGLGVLGIVVLAFALSALPRPKRVEPAEIDRSVYLHPIKTEAAGHGEETAPFTGFAVTIDTDPPGALVSIAGVVRGEAPVLANVGCRGSEKVEVRAAKEGFRPMRRELSCRSDTLVKLMLRLER
jgi:hypothetical protein